MLLRSPGFVRYVLAHPGTLALGFSLFRHLADVGFVLLLFAGFRHWGRLLLRWLSPEAALDSLEHGLCAVVLGQALAAVLLMALGLLGLYSQPALWAVFICLAMGAAMQAQALRRGAVSLSKGLAEKLGWLDFACLCLLLCALLAAAVASGAPVTDWDTLGYHLAMPKIYLAQGALRQVPWSVMAHYPQNTEMLYLLALGLRGGQAAQWINLGDGVLFVLAAAALGRRCFGRQMLLPAAAMLCLQPVLQRVAGNAMSDLPAALAILLAFSVLSRVPALCGVLCGIAMSCKLNGVWAAATIGLLLAAQRRSRAGLLAFLGGAAVFGLPWYLRNLIETGNPVWPFYGEWYHATARDVACWHRFRDSVTEGVPHTFWNYLLLPVHLVLSPEKFKHSPHYLVAAFLPLALWRAWAGQLKPVEKLGAAFLILFASFWFAGLQEWRFMLPAAALMSIFVCAWALQLWQEGRYPLRLLALAALIAFLPLKDLDANNCLFPFLGVRSVSSSSSSQERYLELTLGEPYVVLRAANRLLPPDAKVLFFRDGRGYYLDRQYAYADPLNPGVFSYAEQRDADQLRQTVKALGYDYVFYNPTLGGYQGDQAYYERSSRLMEEMLGRYAEVLFSAGPVRLYRLREPREPRSAQPARSSGRAA